MSELLHRENAAIAPDLDLEIRERLWRRGFLADKWTLFDLAARDPDDHLSDLQRLMARNLNGAYGMVLDDKLATRRALGQRFDQPEILISIYDGAVTAWPAWRRLVASDVPETLYAKPVRGAKGAGLVRAELSAGRVTAPGFRQIGILPEGRSLDATEFVNRLRASANDYVVTRGVAQHATLASFHPVTTNTVRALVLRDPGSGTPRLVEARLRVGSRASGPVDNFATGGLAFPIDLASGRLGPGAQRQPGGRVRMLDAHPDSGRQIAGTVLPFWDDVVEMSVAALVELPFILHVGWDIAIGPAGPCIIEGNSYSGVDMFQVHRPLLTDPFIRKFYTHHGILDFRAPILGPPSAPASTAASGPASVGGCA
jgi:hypothetical protein